MKIPVPVDASKDLRRALENIENRLSALEKPSASKPVTSEDVKKIQGELETLRDTSSLTKFKDVALDGDLRVENELTVLGAVDAPHLYEGLIEVVPSGEAGTHAAQRVINLKGSLAIAPGGLSADSIRAREYHGFIEQHGGAIYDGNGLSDAVSFNVWQAPYNCTVVAVRGFIADGTSADINAQIAGNDLLSSDLTVDDVAVWVDGGACQNTAVKSGDSLTVEFASFTDETYVAIMVWVERRS